MKLHIHEYNFDSKIANGHNHRILGYTEGIIGFNMFHFHYYWGICSYTGHTHYFSGFTGLAAKTENGHIHRIEGSLEPNIQHEHKLTGFTSEEVNYIPKRISRTALI
ncbi:MAG: YmaF family protein [Clostridia bacterium]|nr:YmaF family protein [Clostridia bacterium]